MSAADRTASDAERDEARRLLALYDLEILDTPAEERFDRITRVAAAALGVPRAHITLVDADRQWWKSSHGAGPDAGDGTPREHAFCSVAIAGRGPLVVPDAARDPRFADNPLVTGPPHIASYAGQPVHARDGSPVGTICVIGSEPREFTDEQLGVLGELAAWVELELTVAREREELVRMQRRFMATASHELRTPLTVLKGHVEELLDPLPGDGEEDRRLATEAIDRSTGRLVDLVEDVLAGTRSPDAGDALGLAEVELGALVADLVAETPGLTGRVTVRADAPVRVVADARRVRTAVRGLLRDALAGEADSVPVTVHAEDDSGVIELAAAVPLSGVGVALARAITLLHSGALSLRLDPGAPVVTVTLPARGPSV